MGRLKVLSFPICGKHPSHHKVFLFFSATLENFKKVVGDSYDFFKTKLPENEFWKILDEENFEDDVLNRRVLLKHLKEDGFFQLTAPAPPAPPAGNDLQLQSLAFFF